MSGLKPITVNTPTAEEANIYAEDDASIYLSMFGGDGVSTNGQSCKATVLSNNKVRIADGIICVGGHLPVSLTGIILIAKSKTDRVARTETTSLWQDSKQPGPAVSIHTHVKSKRERQEAQQRIQKLYKKTYTRRER